jgi:hypothetical protein
MGRTVDVFPLGVALLIRLAPDPNGNPVPWPKTRSRTASHEQPMPRLWQGGLQK